MENQEIVASSSDKICEPRVCLLELGLSNQGKDDTSNSSWLSLDSCAPDCLLNTNTGHKENTIGEGPATKSLSSCRPIRSCKKKRSTNDVTLQKHAIDMARQLSLGTLVPILKKPRKRACRKNRSLDVALDFGSSSGHGKDSFV